jgi:NitT/TauT family transport system substrate-binding protein
MKKLNIQFTRFSAFYTPLILIKSGGFLAKEGIDANFSIATPGLSAVDALLDGSAHLVQSALSQGLSTIEKGKEVNAIHFAQINEMDGFFLTGRNKDQNFEWKKLIGMDVIIDHGAQPIAMFKYACHKAKINFSDFQTINAGDNKQMDAAFRSGRGDFIHQQGPAPQQLEFDGVGHVVASVGNMIGECGFSSLAATPEWLATDTAKSFMRAYKKSRAFINEASASEIASSVKQFFPDIDLAVLISTIEFYQSLGCWSPHVEITKSAYEATLDIFEYVGQITKRHTYEKCCTLPPSN